MIGIDVIGHVAFDALQSLENQRQLARLLLDLDHIIEAEPVAWNGHATAVYRHMAMRDELAG